MIDCRKLGIRAGGIRTKVVNFESQTAQPSCQSQIEENFSLGHNLTPLTR